MDSLFAYGTLLDPVIWKAVTGAENTTSEDAVLPGHAIFRVEGADFPGIVTATPDEEVPGRIFKGLTPEILARLDAYEDTFYERQEVIVRLEDDRSQTTQAYVVPDHHRLWLSDQTWTLEWFRREARDAYLHRHGFEDFS